MNMNEIQTDKLIEELKKRCLGLVMVGVKANEADGDHWFVGIVGNANLVGACKSAIDLQVQGHMDNIKQEQTLRILAKLGIPAELLSVKD